MEKKEEKRRQQQGATGGIGSTSNQPDLDDRDSDKDDDSEHEDNNAADEEDDQQIPQNYREEGDSGIDQGSCSSTDIKAASVDILQNNDKAINGGKNKNKKKNKQQNTRNSSPVVEEPPIQPPPAAKQQQQQNKKKEEATGSKSTANGQKKNPEQNTLVAKTNQTSNTATNKKSDNHHKKEELQLHTNQAPLNSTSAATATTNITKKKDSNKQKEKENLAPKDLTAAGTANQQHNKQQHPNQQTQHTNPQSNKTETSTTSMNSGNRKSLIFSASKTAEENNKRDLESITSTTLGAANTVNKQHATHVPPKRGEDGWKEVVRKSYTQQSSTSANANSTSGSSSLATPTASNSKESSSATSHTSASSSSSSSSTTITVPGVSTTTTVTSTMPEMTCKKVQVPVNAISRVIGRAGSNINAIRATTGAHIEVEKQGKNQSERSITIKGLTEATKQAHMLILALIKDPDVDILQMLPRINTTIKANVVPPAAAVPQTSATSHSTSTIATMHVGTWDNKTALHGSTSGGGLSNMSSGSSTTSSASSTPGGTNLSSKTSGISVKTTSKIQGGIATPGNKSNQGRAQPSKPFYAQQTVTSGRGVAGGVTANSSNQLKHKELNNKTLSGSSVGGFNSNQKSSTTQQNKMTSSNFGTGVTTQTFAAKLLTGASTASALTGSNVSPAKKSELGTLRSGITAPYGRGKPVPSSTIPSLGGGVVVGGIAQSSNTLSGPIGTFDVAEAAAAVAAANAAFHANNHNSNSTGTTARSVTPIGPPNKQRAPTPTQQQHVAGHKVNNALQPHQSQTLQHQQQQQQNLHINTGNLGDNVNAASIATPGGFGSQLAAKISSEYSLFNDYHQSQWGTAPDNSQIYTNPNTLVNDNLPQADASKAPGYNRNILSSPVGSSKASNSSTPPGGTNSSNLNMATQQTLTILPETGVAPLGSSAKQAARSPASTSGTGNEITPASAANATQAAQKEPTAMSPGAIKPPGAVGQSSANTTQQQQQSQNAGNTVPQPPLSGLAIQRPHTSGQHRVNIPNNNNNSSQQSPPSVQPSQCNAADNSGNSLNFGPIGGHSNSSRNNTNNQAAGEQGRYYDPTTQMNMAAQMGFQMDPSLMQQHAFNSANSRLNPRASVFGQQQQQQQQLGNKSQPSQQQMVQGAAMYHQQQQNQNQQQQQQPPNQQNQQQQQQGGGGGANAFNAAPGKPLNPGLTPQRPQSQPQAGQSQQNQRWYGSDYTGGYVPPSTRDILNLENGSASGLAGAAGTNSPAAMSPNQSGNVNNPAGILQTPPQMQIQQSADDMRKMPRPIGTERASWKYNNYPIMANMGMGVGGLGGAVGLTTMDDTLAAMTAAAAAAGMPAGPMPPWLMGAADKQAAATAVQQQQQQQQQHSNWMKQQYRFYGQAAGAAPGGAGLTGIGGPGDYHHQQDQFHMALDYHNTMPPPNLNQNQPMNLIPTYTYPHFLGHVGGNDMSHMPEKIELWDHHDKHTWGSNWSN